MKMMYYNVAACLLVIAVSNDMVLSCPSDCSCITNNNGVTVDCSSRGLTVIPRNFPNDSYRIEMNNNPFTTIEKGTFQNLTLLYSVLIFGSNLSTIETGAFITLPNLYIIDLEDNHITIIQPGAFKHLPAIYAIYLFSNQINAIQRGIFDNLQALIRLSLYNNQITALQRGMFGNLQALTELDLRNNQITTIQQGAFQTLSALQTLDLLGNNLTFIKNDTFEHNTNLQYLYLDLVCDCNFPFWSWLKSKSLFNDVGTCVDRDNIKLSSLHESDFDNCTYVSCYPDYCSNGGSCSQNSYGDLVCSCVGGWIGTTCTGE
ncbi:slit homolog 1 protein-like isoform X2 [Mytilus californianus]|uniref:slit homolog 1 protein-like isoform X2 n=1 Tax=Mytilus californianus TaxID=6549 RepID=UPI0022462816|nr:slit homolog 1 protein-like isoform X2 [Mytilus californianus]